MYSLSSDSSDEAEPNGSRINIDAYGDILEVVTYDFCEDNFEPDGDMMSTTINRRIKL